MGINWDVPISERRSRTSHAQDVNQPSIVASPPVEDSYALAAGSGLRDAAAGLAGLGDLAVTGANWVDPNAMDWVTGLQGSGPLPKPNLGQAALDAYGRMTSPEAQAYQPQTGWGKTLAGAAEAGGTFAVPGGLGVRYVKGMREGARGLSGGLGQAAQQFRRGAGSDWRRNAASLAAANAGGVAGYKLATEAFPDNPWAHAAAGMVGGVAGGPAARHVASSGTRQAARQSAQQAVPEIMREGRGTGRFAGLTGRLSGRIRSGEVRPDDVVEAGSRLREVLIGRRNPITDIEIEEARALGDLDMVQSLERQRQVFDDIIDELHNVFPGLSPSTVQQLEGAGLAGGRAVSFDRALAQRSGPYEAELLARRAASQEAAAARARELYPEDAGGTPGNVYEAAREAHAEAKLSASEPYTDLSVDISGIEPIPIASVDRVNANIARGGTKTAAKHLDEKFVDELWEVADADGYVPAAEYRDVLGNLDKRIRDVVAKGTDLDRKRILIDQRKRLKKLMLNRANPLTRLRLIAADKDFEDFKHTYEPDSRPRGRARLNEEDLIAQRTANILLNKDTGDPLDPILKSTAVDPVAVSRQVKKIMREDPQRVAEFEGLIWNRIFAKAIDPDVDTSVAATKALRETRPNDPLLRVYREIAGDEKADHVADLLKSIRQSKIGDAGTTRQARMTDSSGLRGDIGIPQTTGELKAHLIKKTLEKVSSKLSDLTGNDRELQINRILEAAMLDPKIAADVLQLPTREAFDAWRERLIGYSQQAAARQGIQVSGDRQGIGGTQ